MKNLLLIAANKMQVELTKREYGELSPQAFADWTGNHAERFREVVNERPEFVLAYLQGDESEKVLDAVESALAESAQEE